MLLAAVVETSRRVTETSRRLEKVDLLARLLHELRPGEIEIVVRFLAGSIRQGRIGIGYAALRDSRGAAAGTPSLEVAEVDQNISVHRRELRKRLADGSVRSFCIRCSRAPPSRNKNS